MLKKLSVLLAAGAAAVATAYGAIQYQAQKVEQRVDDLRSAHLAAFDPKCPFMKAPLKDYMRAWDRQLPLNAAVAAFAKNQRQYFPDLTAEQAKACFIAPAE